MRPSSTRRVAVLAATGLITFAAGCDSDSTAPPLTPVPTTAPSIRVDDGVLTIGVLIPQDSANADIGVAIRTAVDLAGRMINSAGGVKGQPVQVIRADEGTGIGVEPGIDKLLDANVDAIVGPASSINALAGLSKIINAGVVACSPTASAALLDSFPDKGLFFRTIPSDSLQAKAIAEEVDLTGASQATVVYIDDAYGQLFNKSVQAALRTSNIAPTEAVPFSPNSVSIVAAAGRVKTLGPGVVVVIGDPTSGRVMLSAIDSLMPNRPLTYVVNDAMRRSSTSAEPMTASLAHRIIGISPIAYSSNAQFLADLGATSDNSNPFAANAFDCVNLIALAALSSNSTQPFDIAAQVPLVSASGSPCMSFAACRDDLVAIRNINYDGPGGRLTIGSNGDLTEADFEVFGFRDTGLDYKVSTLTVLP